MNKDNIIKDIVETGSEISGSISGAVIGGLIAGPSGIILGGASGPIITKVFKAIGTEIKQRVFGNRESMRIGAVYTFAINKIQQNQLNGQNIRQDGFFNDENNNHDNRSSSEELLEGIILSAQKEYEEKKVKFLGNLYGNICTNENITKEQSNQLIKITNLLSYRQFCFLQLLYLKKSKEMNFDFRVTNLENRETFIFDVVSELKDLQQKNLVFMTTLFDDFEKVNSVVRLKDIFLTDGGKFYCEILGLNEIEEEDLNKVNQKIELNH